MTVTTWYCNVSVASIWTSPESARELDEEGLSHPVNLNKWLEKLTYERRLDLCNGNRIQTQLIYGEPVIVDDVQGNWAKVIAVWQPSKKDKRGYPGWVPVVQLTKAVPIEAEGFAKVIANKAQLWHTDGSPQFVIPFNVILPYVIEQDGFVQVKTPAGDALILRSDIELAPSIHQFKKYTPEVVVEKGLQFLDLPYFWGGMSSYGYDCSGFTYNLMKAGGHYIPRDAADQAICGEEVDSANPALWERGDLLFFSNDQGNVRHVGFYFGNGIVLHSPSTGQSVELLKLKGSKLEDEICAVRRFFVNPTLGQHVIVCTK